MFAALCAYGWLAAILPFCDLPPQGERYIGYVEGETLLIAPREPGRLVDVFVRRGDVVEKGALLFRIEDQDARDALSAARAELERLRAELSDLKRGRRPEEIAVTRAQLAEAEAALREAERRQNRQVELYKQKVVAIAALDQTRLEYERAQAQVETLRRQIDVQEMPAREDAIAGAQSKVAAQEANVAQARWRLEQRSVSAPAAGLIENVLRDEGEMTGPDAPALSLLPPDRRLIRFFVPEGVRGTIHPGEEVAVYCDGCAGDYRARITYVAAQAEYAPPVIYSVERREKLVYLVEARPLSAAARLDPGQPVEVEIVNARATAGIDQ